MSTRAELAPQTAATGEEKRESAMIVMRKGHEEGQQMETGIENVASRGVAFGRK
jgi:hypothetical protein